MKKKIILITGTVVLIALDVFIYITFSPDPLRYAFLFSTIVVYIAFLLALREIYHKNN